MADDYSDFTKVDSKPKTGEIPYVGAPLEGWANTMTAGTFDYVPAAMAWTVGKLRGDNYSFKEVLDAARQRTAEVRKGSPIGYGAGQVAGVVHSGVRFLGPAIEAATPALATTMSRVAGSAAPAAARIEPTMSAAAPVVRAAQTAPYVAPWARKVAPWVAAPAVFGAEGLVSGAAQSDGDLGETLKSGGWGVLAGTGAKAIEPVIKGFGKGFLRTQTNLARDRAKEEAKDIIATGEVMTPSKFSTLFEKHIDDVLKESSAGTLPKTVVKKIVSEVSSAVVPGTIGAAAGAGLASYKGLDPYEGAKWGAGLTVAATKLKVLGEASDAAKLYGSRMAAKYPNSARDIGSTGANNATQVGAMQPPPRKQSETDYSEFTKDDYSEFTKVD